MELPINMIFRIVMEYNRSHELRANLLTVGEEAYRVISRCYVTGLTIDHQTKEVYLYDCKVVIDPNVDVNSIAPSYAP